MPPCLLGALGLRLLAAAHTVEVLGQLAWLGLGLGLGLGSGSGSGLGFEVLGELAVSLLRLVVIVARGLRLG